MQQAESQSQVGHLLWCILVALRTAQDNHNIKSELGKRRFISEWLKGARRTPAFIGMGNEFTSIRQLLDADKSVSIDGVINTLWMNAVASDKCQLFRFRTAMNFLSAKGWKYCLCPWPEQVIPEIMERQKSHKRHILQLTRMEESFSPTGSMISPVTCQLILNRRDDDLVEQAFFSDSFSIVQGKDTQLHKSIIRTIFIGHHSLPETAWGITNGDFWKPKSH